MLAHHRRGQRHLRQRRDPVRAVVAQRRQPASIEEQLDLQSAPRRAEERNCLELQLERRDDRRRGRGAQASSRRACSARDPGGCGQRPPRAEGSLAPRAGSPCGRSLARPPPSRSRTPPARGELSLAEVEELTEPDRSVRGLTDPRVPPLPPSPRRACRVRADRPRARGPDRGRARCPGAFARAADGCQGSACSAAATHL